MTWSRPSISADLEAAVERALTEDIGGGDIAAALIPDDKTARVRVRRNWCELPPAEAL